MEGDLEPQLVVKKTEHPQLAGPGLIWILIVVVLIFLGLSIVIFGKDNGGSSVLPEITPTLTPEVSIQAKIYTISYKAGVFSPTNLRIHSGDTVKFKNDSSSSIRVASDPHPEHNNLMGFDSAGDIPSGSTYSFTFAAKGIFGYHNERKLTEIGTIIVR